MNILSDSWRLVNSKKAFFLVSPCLSITARTHANDALDLCHEDVFTSYSYSAIKLFCERGGGVRKRFSNFHPISDEHQFYFRLLYF